MQRPLLQLAPIALALVPTAASAQDAPTGDAPAKSDLKVLLVSHDPAAPQVPFPDMAQARTIELFEERAALWKAFLDEHFEDVRLVYGADYEVAMSAAADVTIFDARPPVAKAAVRDGGQYEPAEYLPRDFAHAAITISDNSPRLGEPLGLKLDWL
jgi:hypothetical protein